MCVCQLPTLPYGPISDERGTSPSGKLWNMCKPSDMDFTQRLFVSGVPLILEAVVSECMGQPAANFFDLHLWCKGSLAVLQDTNMAVAQTHVPKIHLGKWSQRLKPA